MDGRFVLGVDIGGTKIAAGVVDESGKVLNSIRVPMYARGSADAAMACVHQAIQRTLESKEGSRVSAIGVSSPGPLDPITGTVLHTPNLPCWINFPLSSEIEQAYRLPTRLENDANAAGLAEARWGAAKGCAYVLYLTLGTGIGTALIVNGKIYGGRTGAAPEGGHMSIDYRGEVLCGCGKAGCVEGLASGTAIAALARKKAHADPSRARALLMLSDGDFFRINAESVFKAAAASDPLALEMLQHVNDVLAIWLGNLLDLFEPHIVVVGGGVGVALSPYLETIREKSLRWTLNSRAGEISLVAAHFGPEAGLVGSSALWLQEAAHAGGPTGNIVEI